MAAYDNMEHSPSPFFEEEEAEIVVAATFKVLVLGNSNVGKTSLISLYSSGRMSTRMMPTIGMDFTDVVVSVRGTKVKLRIWDTAGQERFHTFTKQFFRGAQGIILVYDVTSMESFQTLVRWIQTVHDSGLHDVPMVIVGNKCDLNDRRIVPQQNGEKLAKRHRQPYVETSVKTGTNVKATFYKLAESLIHNHNIFQPGQEADTGLDSDGDITVNLSKSSPLNGSFTLEESEGTTKCCQKR